MIPLVAIVLGCGGPPHECDVYRDNANAWPLCITRWAAAAPTIAEAERRCDTAPANVADCRAAWVDAARNHPGAPSRDELLRFCRSDDCAFRVIDADPPADILATLDLCATRAGAFGGDCATHAYARWAVADPDPEEITRVRAAPSLFADRRDVALGHLHACSTPPRPCPEEYATACAAAAREVAARPGFCAQWREHSRTLKDIERP